MDNQEEAALSPALSSAIESYKAGLGAERQRLTTELKALDSGQTKVSAGEFNKTVGELFDAYCLTVMKSNIIHQSFKSAVPEPPVPDKQPPGPGTGQENSQTG